MKKVDVREKLIELEEKLTRYEKKLENKKLGFGEVVRTRFGDSYADQLRDDVNALELIINSTKEAIKSLEKK